MSPKTAQVLKQHNIPLDMYNQLNTSEKIVFSTQLRKLGRISTPHLQNAWMWAMLSRK
jgi:hypothetical protein